MWIDETWTYPYNLAHTWNTYEIDDSSFYSETEVQSIIDTYLGHVNDVSGETFEMHAASIGYEGMHTFDTDD